VRSLLSKAIFDWLIKNTRKNYRNSFELGVFQSQNSYTELEIHFSSTEATILLVPRSDKAPILDPPSYLYSPWSLLLHSCKESKFSSIVNQSITPLETHSVSRLYNSIQFRDWIEAEWDRVSKIPLWVWFLNERALNDQVEHWQDIFTSSSTLFLQQLQPHVSLYFKKRIKESVIHLTFQNWLNYLGTNKTIFYSSDPQWNSSQDLYDPDNRIIQFVKSKLKSHLQLDYSYFDLFQVTLLLYGSRIQSQLQDFPFTLQMTVPYSGSEKQKLAHSYRFYGNGFFVERCKRPIVELKDGHHVKLSLVGELNLF
jgi:hypothetical protein